MRFLFSFLTILWPCVCFSHLKELDESDTLVLISELEFQSQYENQSYFDLYNNGGSAFEVLMSVNDNKSSKLVAMDKNMLENEISRLSLIPIPKKKKEKYIKDIYARVHDRFLKKYELENYFAEIFDNGNYNCVSACALYSLIFEGLNIPFIIKETPTHVYLIVDFDGERILIETTDPIGGFTKFSSSFKSNFVKMLAESKLISESEYMNNQAEVLFDRFYFTETNLVIKELVALQYSNTGIFQIDKSQFSESVSSLRKSYLLYPNKKSKDLLLYAMGRELAEQEYDDLNAARLLCALARYGKTEVKDGHIENEFYRITDHMLINDGNHQLYDSTYNYLKNNLSRPDALKEIDYFYNYEKGRIQYNKGNYKQALPYLEKSFTLKPNNANIESLFLSCLGHTIRDQTDNSQVLKDLKYLLSKFQVLSKNNNFGGIYLDVHLLEMASMFSSNRFSEGKHYKLEFEKTLNEHPNYKVQKDLIGRAYSQLAVYYFKRSQYTNAKSAINKGLEYAPGNFELKNRKRMIGY